VHPGLTARVEQGRALGHLDLPVVYGKRWHLVLL
jgi:hypothetical protein